MLKKTISYDDLDGNQITEDFYFNLSRVEVVELGAADLEGQMQKLLKTQNMVEVLHILRKFIAGAVGKRSEDGKRFIKSQEITDEFIQSEAFSELFMELVTDADGTKVDAFFKGLMPAKMQEQIKDVQPAKTPRIETVQDKDTREVYQIDADTGQRIERQKPWLTENREPTSAELRSMTKDEIVEAMMRKHNQA